MNSTQVATPAASTPAFTPASGHLVPRASLVLLLLTLPLFLAIDVPVTGWTVAAGIWIVGIVLHAWVRTIARHASPNAAIGLAAAAMFVRTTIALIALLYVGVSVDVGDTTFGLGKPDVAVVALVLYTLVFTLDMGERISADVSARRSISAAREEGE